MEAVPYNASDVGEIEMIDPPLIAFLAHRNVPE